MEKRKIIEIIPTDKWYSITWGLGNRCNQSCCYCPPEFHSDNGKIYSLEELKGYWIDIVNKTHQFGLKYKISFTGGEPTIQKSFLPFLEWLRANYADQIGLLILSSNGSASVNYYLRTFKVIDNLSISLHSEFINEELYFQKIVSIKKALPEGKFFHVNLMDEPWNRQRIPYYEQILKDHNIYYTVNVVNNYGDKPFIPIANGNLNFDLSKPYQL